MKQELICGLLAGFIITLAMRYVPIFHGFDSNDVKRVMFKDQDGKNYILIPTRVDCT